MLINQGGERKWFEEMIKVRFLSSNNEKKETKIKKKRLFFLFSQPLNMIMILNDAVKIFCVFFCLKTIIIY